MGRRHHHRNHTLGVVSAEDIAGSYTVASFNRIESWPNAVFEFTQQDEDLLVHAVVANTLTGVATLTDNVLKGTLLSTRLAGTEDEAKLESFFTTALSEGARVKPTHKGLALKHGKEKLFLVRA